MKKNPLLLITVMLMLLAATCRKDPANCHTDLTIVNASQDTVIYALVSTNVDHKCNLDKLGDPLKPGDRFIFNLGHGSCWENAIETMDMYFVDTKHFNTPLVFYSCDSIEYKNKVLKKFQFTAEALHDSNFTVTYR